MNIFIMNININMDILKGDVEISEVLKSLWITLGASVLFVISSIHYLNTTDKSILRINNYNIKIETENNYSIFFNDINNYNNNLFVCDFENMDYFWLSKLNSLQNNNLIVQ